MQLKVAYDDNSEQLIVKLKEVLPKYPLVELEAYHEQLFKERKKAFAIKNEWGTRMTPFAILIDNDYNPVVAFYSEQNNCTLDKIAETLDSYVIYNKTQENDCTSN